MRIGYRVSRRGFLRLGGASAGLSALGLAGCGGGGDSGSGDIHLTWWDYFEDANGRAMDERLARYQELNPGVTVERRSIPFDDLKQTLLQGASANELPDIAVIDNPDHASFAELGILADLTERAEAWGQRDAYFPGPWDSVVWDGRVYGIPDNSNCLTLFYNEEMLEEAGIDPPTSWEELTAAVEALSEGSRYGLAISAVQSEEGAFQWLPFLWQAGADLDNLASPGGEAALELVVDYVDRGWMSQGILGWDQAAAKDEFVQGQAAMMINGPWQIPAIEEEAPDLPWNVTPLPEGDEPASILGGENLAIVATSENVDAAWDLLTWTQEADGLRDYLVTAGKLPSREDMADDPEWSDDPVLAAFTEQLRVARPRAYGPHYPEMSNAVQIAIQAAVSGDSSVPEALATAQEQIDDLMAQ